MISQSCCEDLITFRAGLDNTRHQVVLKLHHSTYEVIFCDIIHHLNLLHLLALKITPTYKDLLHSVPDNIKGCKA